MKQLEEHNRYTHNTTINQGVHPNSWATSLGPALSGDLSIMSSRAEF